VFGPPVRTIRRTIGAALYSWDVRWIERAASAALFAAWSPNQMTVIPFRPRPRSANQAKDRLPPLWQIFNACLRTSICLYIYPWMWCLEMLREHDDYPLKDYD
jgi:hypothetical protein